MLEALVQGSDPLLAAKAAYGQHDEDGFGGGQFGDTGYAPGSQAEDEVAGGGGGDLGLGGGDHPGRSDGPDGGGSFS